MQSCLYSIYACARFIQHKLVINACVSDLVVLQTTLLISCIMWVKIIRISSSRWWRFEFETSAIEQHLLPKLFSSFTPPPPRRADTPQNNLKCVKNQTKFDNSRLKLITQLSAICNLRGCNWKHLAHRP